MSRRLTLARTVKTTASLVVLTLLVLAAFPLLRTTGDNPVSADLSPQTETQITETRDAQPLLGGTRREPVTALAPPVPHAWPDLEIVVDANSASPEPPDGYSFVSHGGTMQRLALKKRPEVSLAPNPEWMASPGNIEKINAQAARMGRNWTFATVRIAPNQREVADRIERQGAVLVLDEGEYLHIKLPASQATLKAIESLPGVLGLGVVPAEIKMPAGFAEESLTKPAGESLPVTIRLVAKDENQEWRTRLEAMGVKVGEYQASLRVYEASMPHGSLSALIESDYVLSVEPVQIVYPALDTAVSVMGADGLRRYDAGTGNFVGLTGKGVPIGVLDTGLNIGHPVIHPGRDSVCGANFVDGEDWDLWTDTHGHGTAMTGVILANAADPLSSGMAPSVNHIRFAKVLGARTYGRTVEIARGMRFLMGAIGCDYAGQASEYLKPLIVNASIGGTGRFSLAQDQLPRTLDFAVHSARQLYVPAAGNLRSYPENLEEGVTDLSAAKNSLSVGMINDFGMVWEDSGTGPTSDGRLAPNLVAIGYLHPPINKTRGDNPTSQGTSLSAASVTGLAALLMEADPAFKNNPALARARLMASAIRPEAFLKDSDAFRRDNTKGPGTLQNRWGLGIASARTSVLTKDVEGGWLLGSRTSEPQDGAYEYVAVDVPEDAARLDVVMTWDEQPAGFVGEAVINDLDLWVDAGADCGDGPCGEHSSRSSRDNVEWAFIDNPQPGKHHIKIVPKRLYGEPVNVAVAWMVVRADPTPNLQVELNPLASVDEESDGYRLYEARITTSGFVATGTKLAIACGGDADARCAWSDLSSAESGYGKVFRQDGLERPVEWASVHSLGEIAVGEVRRVILPAGTHEPSHLLYLVASAANAQPGLAVLTHRTKSDPDSAIAPQTSTVPETFPENDNFKDAERLKGIEGTTNFKMPLATTEPGEDLLYPWARTLWYIWTASASGTYRFHLTEAESGLPYRAPRLGFFEGDSIVSLNPHTIGQYSKDVLVEVEAGKTLRLQIESGIYGGFPIALAWERTGPLPAEAEESDDTGGTDADDDTPTVQPTNLDGATFYPSPAATSTRPANDNFADAERISGETGHVIGEHLGATLERQEFWDRKHLSVWYQWTAPADGYWKFSVSDEAAATWPSVAVFSGEALDDLTLRSHPVFLKTALFPAKAGETYRILVVGIPKTGGQDIVDSFTLQWSLKPSPDPYWDWQMADNDLITNAHQLDGTSGALEINETKLRSTEHGERKDFGTGTLWWRWTAPKSATYTWRVNFVARTVLFERWTLSILEGKAPPDSALVTQQHMNGAATFQARAGQNYWICAGQLPDYSHISGLTFITLEWGETPVNNNRDAASPISGASGSERVTLKFATTEASEPSQVVGHRSMWWHWTPESDGWHRFWVQDHPGESALSIHSANGVGGIMERPITTSERSFFGAGRVEAFILAKAGEPYHIRLAERTTRPAHSEYELRWSRPSSPPALLGYKGEVNKDSFPKATLPDTLTRLADLAMSDDGAHLITGSHSGLSTLARSASDGSLSYASDVLTLADKVARSSGVRSFRANDNFLWDDRAMRLYVINNPRVRAYQLTKGTGALQFAGKMQRDEWPGTMSVEAGTFVKMDPTGKFIYQLAGQSPFYHPLKAVIRVFRRDAELDWTAIQVLRAFPSSSLETDGENEEIIPELTGVSDFVLSSNARFLYAIKREGLLILARDAETGRLTMASEIKFEDKLSGVNGNAIAIDSKDQLLFITDVFLGHLAVFDILTDPTQPKLLDRRYHFSVYDEASLLHKRARMPFALAPPPEKQNPPHECDVVQPHANLPAVDVFCDDVYYVASWDKEEGRLIISDWGVAGQPDRFGATLPHLFPRNRSDAEVSPDGHDLYLIQGWSNHSADWRKYPGGDSIYMFERAGAMSARKD